MKSPFIPLCPVFFGGKDYQREKLLSSPFSKGSLLYYGEQG